MKRSTKRAALGFAGVILLVGFVFAGAVRYLESQKERQRYEEQRGSLKPPEPVAVEVGTEALKRERVFTADLEPWVEAVVPAEVSGRVVSAPIEAGERVEKGQELVRLDETRAKISLEVSQARHEEALRLVNESKKLRASRVVSQSAMEAAMAEARVTGAQMREAEDSLMRHTVQAPFGGVVMERLVDVGEAVTSMQGVARLVDLERLRVVFHVTAGDLPAFQAGRTVPIRLMGSGRETLEPVIRYVSPSAYEDTLLYRVEAELPNPDGKLPGGLQAAVRATVEVYPDGPVVPAAAVRFRGDGAVVLRDPGNGEAAEEVRVRLGPEIDGKYPVLDGLRSGDKIFIR